MNNMLHMKLLLSSTALLLTLSNPSFASDLELKPISDFSSSYKLAKVCFLPDCGENGFNGDINMDVNNDTRWCEKKGYTYYATGACPQYYKKTDTCKKDNHYLKCDAAAWCKDNGYNTSTCSLPAFVDTQCPNGQPLYKSCKEDTARACKQVGYKNTCSGSQKLHASNGRCSWNNSYGTCCSPSGCPSHTGLSGPYGDSGSQDGCGYKCYYTCDMNCPSGTSTSNPGGCGGSTRNGCNTKTCYYPYQACCTPNCTNQSGCAYGTTSVSDGCGGSCTRCKEQPCNSSHPRWCRVHGSCHTDCCKNGSIQSCDPQCGGSGCSNEEKCKAAGYIYSTKGNTPNTIWRNGSNGCGGHFQKYYLLPEWFCPYDSSFVNVDGCGVCSNIPHDSCISSHRGMVDIGRGSKTWNDTCL